MPTTYEITAPNGKTLSVSGDHVPSESELRDIFHAAGVETDAPDTAPAAEGAANPRTLGTGLTLAGADAAMPLAARGVTELATNPAVPRLAAAAGRTIGAIAAPVVGAVEGGPMGAALGVAEAGKAAWAAGKTGWFTGKLAQSAAAPIATAAEKVAPYAKGALNTLAGVQSLLDLAQVADPNRKDIGTLGVSTNPPRSVSDKQAHPAVLNAMADALKRSVQAHPEVWSTVLRSLVP